MYLSLPRIFSPFGDEDALFNACCDGKRAFKKENFINKDMLVGKIDLSLPNFSHNTPKMYQTRTNQILLATILALENEIKNAIKRYGKYRIGVVIGTTTAGMEENYEAFRDGGFYSDKFIMGRNALSNPANFVREFLGLESLSMGVSTACTSGIKAFESARNFIKLDLCDAVIVGGVDSLSSLTLLGFNSLGVLSDSPSRPFCKDRDGINIGEAAASFLMCRDKISDYRLKMVETNCDAFHITQPNPEATEQIKLINSLTSKYKIDYINAHATGTQANEIMESKAIFNTLSDTPTSGIKANIGHTLGAAGAVEAGICLMAIKNQMIPMQILDELDGDLLPINLATKSTKSVIKNCLNLSFAFGGDNAGMVVGVDDES